MSLINFRLMRCSGIRWGHTREHSPQSVQRPATCHARMIWYMLSSKLEAATFCAAPDAGLSNTHVVQVQAGQTSRHALQRIQRESSFCQNAKRSSSVIASSFATSSKRAESRTSPSSPISSSQPMCFLLLHTAQRSDNSFFSGSFMPSHGTPIAYTSLLKMRCSFSNSVKL